MTICGSASEVTSEIPWRRNQAAVTAATFIGFTGFTLVMPFLPLYFEQLGVHDQGEIAVWSGVSLGITPAVTAVMAPVWARVAERFGRKLMVTRSLASFVIIMGLLGYVQAPWQVFGLRAIQGLFAGYGPIAMTMAAESAPPEQMASAIGWVQSAQRLGPALGPVIGGTLAQTLGLRNSFLVSASFYVVALLLVVFGFRDQRVRRVAEPADLPGSLSFQSLRRVPHFLLFMGTVFGLQLVDRSFGPILPLYLREANIGGTAIPFLAGVIFTTTAALGAVGNQASGWLMRRWRPSDLVPAAAALAAVATFVFGAGAPIAVLLVTAAILGLGLGVATTCVYTAATQAVSPTARGVAFGYLTTAYLAGLAVSPVAAGLVGSFSVRAVFLVDAVGLGILAWIVRKEMAGRS
jgi:DHA1 family multidrug resistance protein-like MFS transporter